MLLGSSGLGFSRGPSLRLRGLVVRRRSRLPNFREVVYFGIRSTRSVGKGRAPVGGCTAVDLTERLSGDQEKGNA